MNYAPQFKQKTRQLIQYILSVDSLSLDELEDSLSLSRRMLYYLLEDINTLLRTASLDAIHTQATRLVVTDAQRAYLQQSLQHISLSQLILTSSERQQLILLALLLHGTIRPSSLIQQLNVSRSTFYHDLTLIKQQILTLPLQLIQDTRKGYWRIEGPYETKRLLIIQLLKELSRSLSILSIDFIDNAGVHSLYQRLLTLSQHPSCHLNPRSLESIAILLSYHYAQTPPFSAIPRQAIFPQILSLFPELSSEEQGFLMAVTIGNTSHQGSLLRHDHILEMCHRIVGRFELQNQLHFHDRDSLIQQIYSHLLLNGYLALAYDYQLRPSTLSEIKNKYNELYLRVQECLKPLQVTYPILDDEFIRLGIMLKIGVCLRNQTFVHSKATVFLYIEHRPLFNQVHHWLNDYNQELRILDMMDFTYMPEDETKGRLLITTVPLSQTYHEMPIVMLGESFGLEDKIQLMLALELPADTALDLDTSAKIFKLLKDEFSLVQLEYYIKKLSTL